MAQERDKIESMNQKGFIPIIAVIVIVVVIGIAVSGGTIYYATKSREATKVSATMPPAPKPLPPTPSPHKEESFTPSGVSWNFDFDGQEWIASGNPPACPHPLKMQSPVDVSLATGVLYPGQYRGSDYKTHGGFRFDNSTNAVTIKAPMDAYISRASRYIQDGEVQYLFFFIAPCGVMYRFDHLLTLAPKLQEIAESLLPPAKPDDSRTTDISERRIMVKAGEIVAIEIGFKTPQNVGVDFGVYDLRDSKEMTFYALCFLDVLPEGDASRLKTLPSGVEGKSSDYCK